MEVLLWVICSIASIATGAVMFALGRLLREVRALRDDLLRMVTGVAVSPEGDLYASRGDGEVVRKRRHGPSYWSSESRAR